MDEFEAANLGWKGIATVIVFRYFIPWARDKIAVQRLELARKYARESVRWALSKVPVESYSPYRSAPSDVPSRTELEQLALQHLRFIATGAIKKWVDKDLLSSIRDVWREVEVEIRYEQGMAFDVKRQMEEWSKVPTVTDQLDKLPLLDKVSPQP